MAKLLGMYKNGNYFVEIYNDGTKVRMTNEDEFKPEFPESIDCTITTFCDNGCKECYLNCTTNGIHANLLSDDVIKIIDSIHPFTELALNGNDLSHPDLIPFLNLLKERNIIANITVNQNHFEKHIDYIRKLISDGLVYGIGVSLVNPTDKFISLIKEFPNAVIHSIAGILSEEQINKLSNNNLSLLILGFKSKGRGLTYIHEHPELKDKIIWLRDNIQNYFNKFKVISFDNLGLLQLDIENKISKEKWDKIYMGDEGSHTFFLDFVNKKFAKSSLETECFDMKDNVTDMFNFIRELKENN